MSAYAQYASSMVNSGLCRRDRPSLRKLRFNSNTFGYPPISSRLRYSSGAMRKNRSMPSGVVARFERLRRRAARDGLHHGRLDFQKTAFVEKCADAVQHPRPGQKRLARLFVRHQIEVTLPVPRLDIDQPVVFVGQRPERLREQSEIADAQRRLTRGG